MADGQLVGAALVAGVHGLGGAEDIGDLLLGFVVVFAEVAEAFGVVHRILLCKFVYFYYS